MSNISLEDVILCWINTDANQLRNQLGWKVLDINKYIAAGTALSELKNIMIESDRAIDDLFIFEFKQTITSLLNTILANSTNISDTIYIQNIVLNMTLIEADTSHHMLYLTLS